MTIFKELPELKHLISSIILTDESIVDSILERFPSTNNLIEARPQDFLSIYGIGQSKANQLYAAFQLARLVNKPKDDCKAIRTPQDVYDLLGTDMRFLQNEHFVCLFLNTKNRIIAKEVISIGSLNAAIVHPREVFRAAIRYNSASIICVHNHPSGDPTPSTADIDMTSRLVIGGETIGIEVLDHVIIGGDCFLSLKEKEFM